MTLDMLVLLDQLSGFSPLGPPPAGVLPVEGVRLGAGGAAPDARCVCVEPAPDACESRVLLSCGEERILLDTPDLAGVLNRLLSVFERFACWERDMLAALSQNASLQTLLDVGCGLIPNPVVISDASHDSLAVRFPTDAVTGELAGLDRLHAPIPPHRLAAINRALAPEIKNPRAFVSHSGAFSNPAVLKNLYSGETLIGWLVILNAQPEDIHLLQWFASHMSDYIERWFEIGDKTGPLYAQAGGVFLSLLSEENIEEERIVVRLNGIDWRAEDRKRVFCLCGGDVLTRPLLQRLLPESFPGCYAVTYDESLLLFCNLRTCAEERLLRELPALLESCGASCGVSYAFTDIAKLKDHFRQAQVAAQYGKKSAGAINICGDYALAYLRDVLWKNLSADLRHPALRQLKDYDAKNQTEYYWTLLVYLLSERELTLTADTLRVHRNTAVYRVARLKELTGLDFDGVATRMHLMVSFLIEDGLDLTHVRDLRGRGA